MTTQIRSPLGVSTVKNSTRVIEVPDSEMEDNMMQEEDSANNFSEEMIKLQRREEALNHRKKLVKGNSELSPGALERISALIGVLQNKRTVNINKNVFILRSLKNYETRDVLQESSKVQGSAFAFELMNQYLARSIISVGGIDIETFIGNDSIEARLIFVENLDLAVSNRLYEEFLILKKETDEKYSIKNDVDAKELVENLKK
jgi:hypothetical protein